MTWTCACLLLATPGQAAEPYVLPEITVQASPLDLYLPAQTEIGREELVGSHKDELTQVLQLAPGVNVRQGGQGEPRVDVRGFDQRATLFTLDGVPVYEPYNGIVNLDLFPTEMLQRVEIARGPSSALYGPNGMAGTVKMSMLQPEAPITAGVSTIWRYDDSWDARASAGVTQGPVSAMLGGRYLSTPGFPLSGDFTDRPPTRRKTPDDDIRLNSDRDEKSGFGDVSYALADGGHVRAAALTSVAEFGIPASTTDLKPQFLREDHEQFDHLQFSMDHPVGASADAGAAVFYSRYDTRQSQFEDADLATKRLSTEAKSDEVGVIGQLHMQLGEHDAVAVATQVRNDGADISDSANGRQTIPHFVTTSTGFENIYLLTDRIRLLMGLSYDLQTGGARGTDWELDPEGGISVDFGRSGTSRAGVSRKIRFPTLRELFDPLQGNPGLRPEKALVYQIGHRIERPSFYADASLFRSDVDDLIDMGNASGEQQAMNLDQAVLQGFETAAGGMLTAWVRADLNYTYLDATARQTGSSRGFLDIQHKPAHRFNGILRAVLPEEFRLRLEGLYTSDQVDTFGADFRVGSYALFNVQVSKTVWSHLEVFAGVDNVLDTDYEDKLGTPQPGRWEYAGLRAWY